jgi:hypothetical protein
VALIIQSQQPLFRVSKTDKLEVDFEKLKPSTLQKMESYVASNLRKTPCEKDDSSPDSSDSQAGRTGKPPRKENQEQLKMDCGKVVSPVLLYLTVFIWMNAM